MANEPSQPHAAAAAAPGAPAAISVDIYDQVYHLRGTDAAYLQRLAQVVDGKMRAVASQGNTVDSLRVAVLAALNLADELQLARARNETLRQSQSALRSRTGSLSGILDEILDERRAG